ncbi:unnamed protein product [Symbiodinium microadriaticum]|nr:unnamed protein product [Symbiodinium microadriaticum]
MHQLPGTNSEAGWPTLELNFGIGSLVLGEDYIRPRHRCLFQPPLMELRPCTELQDSGPEPEIRTLPPPSSAFCRDPTRIAPLNYLARQILKRPRRADPSTWQHFMALPCGSLGPSPASLAFPAYPDALRGGSSCAPLGGRDGDLGGSSLHQARARGSAVMELAPQKHLWIETDLRDTQDVPELSPGDGILWLVAALAQVCQEYAADCSAKIESEVPRPAPPVRTHRRQEVPARGDSRKADRIASKLVQQPQPMCVSCSMFVASIGKPTFEHPRSAGARRWLAETHAANAEKVPANTATAGGHVGRRACLRHIRNG